jgi:serine/threonine protein kinase
LTDFELAKLLADAPTVAHAADWEHVDDPYRAPEVSAKSPVLGPASDVYSWGRIVLHATTGHLPPVDSDDEATAVNQLPKSIRVLIGACVAIDSAKRPQSMDEVLRGIKKWE